MSAEGAAQPDGIRIGDVERECAIDELRRQTGQGRLELDEFSDRVEAVLAARHQTDLDVVMVDLPVNPASAVAGSGAVGNKTVFGVLSGSRQKGVWRVPAKVTAFSFWGSVQLDFRNALLDSPEVRVDAVALMGSVDIVVPKGIPVEIDGGVLMGGLVDKRSKDAPIAGAPVIRVFASGIWGSVVIRSKGSGHTLAAPPQSGSASPPVGRVASDVSGAHLPEQHSTVAILVTDIVSSTSWAEQLGDQQWLGVLQQHNRLVREQLAVFGGTEVKQNGDGFLATFPSAASAVEAGLSVRDAVQRDGRDSDSAALEVRVGVHAGEVARDDGDVFGVNVSTADRVCAAAEPDQVLVSGVVADLADSSTDVAFDPPRELTVSGRSKPIRVHEARTRL